MGIKEEFYCYLILIASLIVFIIALLNRKAVGLKGIAMAFLLTISGLALVICSMFIFGPVVSGTFWLCTASSVPPVICMYHIVKYLLMKKYGGCSEGRLLHWGHSSRIYPRDYTVIGYISPDGEERNFEFKNNVFLSQKRCSMGVNILFDMNHPEKAYVEKYSLMSYVLEFLAVIPILVFMTWLSSLILTGNVI